MALGPELQDTVRARIAPGGGKLHRGKAVGSGKKAPDDGPVLLRAHRAGGVEQPPAGADVARGVAQDGRLDLRQSSERGGVLPADVRLLGHDAEAAAGHVADHEVELPVPVGAVLPGVTGKRFEGKAEPLRALADPLEFL